MKKLIKSILIIISLDAIAQDEYVTSLINELNSIRKNPYVYGKIIEIDLSYISPKQPLLYSNTLSNKACEYLDFMINEYEDLIHSGYPINESLALTYPKSVIRELIIDNNVEDLGHRHHLLGYSKGSSNDSQIGVCYRNDGEFNYVIIWTK